MIIKELYISAYGSLRDRSFEFSENLNILTGENEAGKSTLMSFISFMLYGPDELAMKYIRASVGECGGRMIVTSSDGDLLIERKVSSSETSKKVLERFSLYSLPSMKEIEVKGQPGEYVLGVSRAFFMGTSFVSQKGASSYDSDKTSDAVQNILLSANEKIDTGRALRKIDEIRKYFLLKRGRGGVIANAEDKLSELSNEKFLSEQARAELSQTDRELADLKKKKEENLMLFEALKKEALARRHKEIKNILAEREALADELGTKERELEKAQKYVDDGNLEAARARLRELDFKEKYASARLADAENDAYAAKKALEHAASSDDSDYSEENEQKLVRAREGASSRIKMLKGRATLYLVAAALCAVFAAITAFMQYAVLSAALVGVLATFSVLAFLSLDKKKKEENRLADAFSVYGIDASASSRDIADIFSRARFARENYLELEKKTKETENRLLALKDDLASCKAEINELLSQNKKDDPSLPVSERITAAEKFFSDTLSQPILLKESCRHIKERIALLDRQLTSLGNADETASEPSPAFAAFDNETIRRNAERLSADRESLSEQIADAEGHRDRLVSGIKPADELDALISEARDELAKRREQHDIVLLAEEAVRYSSENLRSSVTPSIIEIGDKLFSEITQDKYNRIGVDESLSPNGIGKESILSADALSYGTNEAMYIAFRLSLLLVLCRDEPSVMLMDESFAHIDDKRTANTLRVLAESGVQSLVFTCSEREGALAENAELIRI